MPQDDKDDAAALEARPRLESFDPWELMFKSHYETPKPDPARTGPEPDEDTE